MSDIEGLKNKVIKEPGQSHVNRRDFLRGVGAGLGAAGLGGVAGAGLGFFQNRDTETKPAEHKEKKISGAEKFEGAILGRAIKDANKLLEEFESDIKGFQEELKATEAELDGITTDVSEYPRTHEELKEYENTLLIVQFNKQSAASNLSTAQGRQALLMNDINVLLSDKEPDTQGTLAKWEAGEYKERKARIEKEMQSLKEQESRTEKILDAVIANFNERIKNGREILKKNIGHGRTII